MQPRWLMYYVYVDWTLEPNSRPFYVGKGDAKRVRSLQRNRHHTFVAKHLGIRREVILETHDELTAFEVKIQKIVELDTFDPSYKLTLTNIRCNKTKGGEGASGFCLSSPRPSITDVTRRRLSESHRGKVFTNDHCEKLRESAKRRPSKSQETRTKISASKRGVSNVRLQKCVTQCDIKGNVINTWSSLTKACIATGFACSCISHAANKRVESYNGFIWRFENDVAR